MEALPLMLQASLSLLGYALSRYFWEVNATISTVNLGFTSFGLLSYIVIVIAGTISENCPYQTPSARINRHILIHYILPALHSARYSIRSTIPTKFSRFTQKSACFKVPKNWWSAMGKPWYSVDNIINTPLYLIIWLFVAPVVDVYRLGRGSPRLLITASETTYRSLIAFCMSVYRWFTSTSLYTHGIGQQAIMLDLRCISWILQTSLDKLDHLSAFNHLCSMPELGSFDPLLVVDCYNAFTGCIIVSNMKLVIMGGLEQHATMAARVLCRTLCQLTVMDPTSSVLTDIRRRYNNLLPFRSYLSGIPFNSTMELIHDFVSQPWNPKNIQWRSHKLPGREHIPFARSMVEVAQVGRQKTQGRKVPRWILRFVLDSLSWDPPPPTSVVASCLLIIAIDLGCDASKVTAFEERYV
jgi:hypothetical protein